MNTILLAAVADSPDGRIFGLDGQTLISIGIQLLNACILAAALTFILYKPVRKFLNNRTKKIEEQLDNAAENQMRAEELKAAYEKKLEELETERIGVLESAHKLAAEKSKQQLLDAEKEISDMKKQAEAEIQLLHERADEELRLYIIETAGVLAEKFVSHTIDENAQNRLFDETIKELEETAWKK